jgi:PBP1b-binding outer membrane lipoprotein LpoB
MKILVLAVAAMFMVGCSTNVTRDVVEVKVPVYTKPKIQKTQRPELISDKVNSAKYDEIVKAVKVDLESLKTYSFILENQLNAIVEYEE